MAEGSGEENQHKSRLASARARARGMAKSAKSAKAQAKEVLSFGKKISEHWQILIWAGVFDLLGLIPFICVVTNAGFTLILWLYFGPKKQKGDPSDFKSIVIPAVIANILDAIISVVPANIGVTLVRILMSKQKEEKAAPAGADGSQEGAAGGAGASEEGDAEGGTGAGGSEAAPMSPLKNTPEMKPVGFCAQCGAPIYDAELDHCLQCGEPLNFDPEAELKKIRQSPRGEQREKLRRYKLQLAHQKEGIETIKRELTGRAQMFPDSTPEMLYNSVAHHMDRYNFSRTQRAAVRKGLDTLQGKKDNINKLLNENRDSQTGEIDEAKIFQKLFRFQPGGKIKMSIEGGGSMLAFKTDTVDDYARILAGGNETVSAEAASVARMSGGMNITGGLDNKELLGSIIVENSGSYGGIGKNEEASKITISHEVQHGINDIMNKAFNAEEENFQKEHKSLDKRAADFNKNVSRGRDLSEFSEKELKERESLVRDIETKNRHARDFGFERKAKDEISAYFTQNKYSPEQLREILLGKGAELYNYAYKHSAEKGQGADGISKDYKRIVDGGIDAMQMLVDNGYTRNQASNILFNEPLRNWSRVAERAVGSKK